MLEGRKYILNLNSGIIFGRATEPEGIGMLIHLDDVEIDPVIIMDKKQAKELIKALKYYIRRSRKWH